jgi:hypothetical protein
MYFGTQHLNQRGAGNSTLVGAGPFVTGTSTETLARSNTLSADSQSFWIGLVHQFGS